MTRAMLFAVLIALPAAAGAEVWRWYDAAGRTHYTNVASRAAGDAVSVRAPVGSVRMPWQPRSLSPKALAAEERLFSRRREERALRRRLDQIHSFYDCTRARQLDRLLGLYPNSFILPDWVVADRWLELQKEEARLQTTLVELERRKTESDPRLRLGSERE